MESYSQPYRGKEDIENVGNGGEVGDGIDEGSDEDDDEENEDNEEGKEGGHDAQSNGYTLQQMQLHAKMVVEDAEDEEGGEIAANSCQLLWQGIQSKRAFTGFKFQVPYSSSLTCTANLYHSFLSLFCFLSLEHFLSLPLSLPFSYLFFSLSICFPHSLLTSNFFFDLHPTLWRCAPYSILNLPTPQHYRTPFISSTTTTTTITTTTITNTTCTTITILTNAHNHT